MKTYTINYLQKDNNNNYFIDDYFTQLYDTIEEAQKDYNNIIKNPTYENIEAILLCECDKHFNIKTILNIHNTTNNNLQQQDKLIIKIINNII